MGGGYWFSGSVGLLSVWWSKCGPQLWAPLGTWIRIYKLTRSPGDVCAHESVRGTGLKDPGPTGLICYRIPLGVWACPHTYMHAWFLYVYRHSHTPAGFFVRPICFNVNKSINFKNDHLWQCYGKQKPREHQTLFIIQFLSIYHTSDVCKTL